MSYTITIKSFAAKFGGLVNLFLGCSIASCLELFYHFTLRFWFVYYERYRQWKSANKKDVEENEDKEDSKYGKENEEVKKCKESWPPKFQLEFTRNIQSRKSI
jgi:hypothetical protein